MAGFVDVKAENPSARVKLLLREAAPAWTDCGIDSASLDRHARPGPSDGQRCGHDGYVVCSVRYHVDRDDGRDDVSVHGSGRDPLDPFYRVSKLQRGGVLQDCPVCHWLPSGMGVRRGTRLLWTRAI